MMEVDYLRGMLWDQRSDNFRAEMSRRNKTHLSVVGIKMITI